MRTRRALLISALLATALAVSAAEPSRLTFEFDRPIACREAKDRLAGSHIALDCADALKEKKRFFDGDYTGPRPSAAMVTELSRGKIRGLKQVMAHNTPKLVP